jgi:hypothetical protein
VAARKRIRELEIELAVHLRATELLKGDTDRKTLILTEPAGQGGSKEVEELRMALALEMLNAVKGTYLERDVKEILKRFSATASQLLAAKLETLPRKLFTINYGVKVEDAARARKGEQEAVALQLDFGQDPPATRLQRSPLRLRRRSLEPAGPPIEEGVLEPVLNAPLTQRFASRGAEDVADKVLSALRYQFGGHEEKHS